MVNLMKRLETFVKSNPDAVPVELDIFGMFRSHLTPILERGNAPGAAGGGIASMLQLQVAFLRFTLALYS